MTIKYREFECGCKIEITDFIKTNNDGIESLNLDFYNNIKLDCPATWELLCSGKVTGCFQLESSLGKHWSKKVSPVCIDDASALIALLRPSCTQAYVDGKNMAQHYTDRKDGNEDYENFHPEVDEIIDSTYGIILYQEQALFIARKFAGFNLEEADNLRKAIGHKDAALMQETRLKFITGCIATKLIDETEANNVFDIIEKSARFSFNLAHSREYSEILYWTAYIKAHFPLHFFTAWLAGCNNKADTEESVGELVSDSKSFKIPIVGPSILKSSENFSIQDLTIRCGLGNIRGVAESGLKKIHEAIERTEKETNKKLKDLSWFECLIYLLPQVSKTIVSNMLATGCFSHLQMSRQLQMFEYNKVLQLTDKEIEKVKAHLQNNLFATKFGLLDALDYLIANTNKGRSPKIVSIRQSVTSPPSDVRDTEEWIANVEEHIIGASITCSKLDSCNTSSSNITCKQFNEAKFAKNCVICGQITRLSEYQPKGGKMTGMTMAYITLIDATGPCEAVAFPNQYKENSMVLFKGNTVMVTGNKSDKGSFTINKVEQI